MAQGVCFVWRRNPPVAYGDSPPNSGAFGISQSSPSQILQHLLQGGISRHCHALLDTQRVVFR